MYEPNDDDVYDAENPSGRATGGINVNFPDPDAINPWLQRVSILFGVFLVLLGGLALLSNLLPSFGLAAIDWPRLWPTVLIAVAVMFFMPAVVFPEVRAGLAGLYVPGMLIFFLGAIFQYQVITGDWLSWAYAWLLLPASIGMGLAVGAIVGRWGRSATMAGFVMFGTFAGIFGIFATFLGQSVFLRVAGPVLLIVLGLTQLWRGFSKRANKTPA